MRGSRLISRGLATLPALVALTCVCWPLACGDRQVPKNVLLISVDTLRATALGCYGNLRPTSPTIDRLARGGVLFENAVATSPWTLPSHASLFTGLYPAGHSLVDHHRILPAHLETWAQLLEERGFATGAVVNAPLMERRYGLNRGFGDYLYVRPKARQKGPRHVIDRDRENFSRVVDLSLSWLSEHEDVPFFFFLHRYQVHSDYHALPRYRDLFVEPYAGIADGSTVQLRRFRDGRISFGQRDAAHLLRLYEAGVRQVDDEIARVLEYLEETGRLEETLVILTSDHGEEFLEHGGVMHGRTQYQEVLHVPLIFQGPSVPEGLRISRPVSLVDVLPTAFGLLGLTSPPDIDGIDLRPLWSDEPDVGHASRFLFAEADHRNDRPNILSAVWHGRYKLIHDRLQGRTALYDLEGDPGEEQDISADRPDIASQLLQELRGYSRFEIESELNPEPLSAEQHRQLVELGYAEDLDRPDE